MQRQSRPEFQSPNLPTSDLPKVYQLKAVMYILCSPEEVLKLLLDPITRSEWDFNLDTCSVNSQNQLKVTYKPTEGYPNDYTEIITFKYLVFNEKFYIIEHVENDLEKYERLWQLDEVQNRPYFMRVTLIAQVVGSFHRARSGCSHFL